MRLLVAILAFSIFFYPSWVWPQEICGPQDYSSAVSPDFECPGPDEESLVPDLETPASIPVIQGSTVLAPWEGVLVHRDRLIETGLRIVALRRLRWADRLQLEGRHRIEVEFVQDASIIREQHLESQVDYYQERAADAERAAAKATKWHRSFWFGALCGVFSAAALVALAAYVVTVL